MRREPRRFVLAVHGGGEWKLEPVRDVVRHVDCAVVIEGVRTGFGGLAATPKRARGVEEALRGQPFAQETFEAAADAVRKDFQPIDDWRGTAAYRLTAAANLLRRLYWRIAEPGRAVEVEAL